MSRIAAPAYTPTEAELAALVERHGLGRLTAWRRLAGGIVNPVLLLELEGGPERAAVLRINVCNPADPKVAKEAWALRFVRERLGPDRPWRVPRVLGADVSRELLPYDYLLLELLPGRMAWELWETKAWSPSQHAALSRQMGEILAELHALPLPGERYGSWDVQRGTLGLYADWRVRIAEANESTCAEVEQMGLAAAARLPQARAWLEERLEVIPPRPRPVLAHNDFHAANVLAERIGADWRITGVLDFEWCGAAPAAAEFAPIMYWLELDPAAFAAGYLDGGAFDPGFLREAHYYEMQTHLDMLCVCHRHWGGEGADEHTRRIDELLRGVPAKGFADAGYAWPF